MEILGLDRQQFYEWRGIGLLGARSGRERLSKADARELAVLSRLQRVIGGPKAATAYRQVRLAVIERKIEDPVEIIWVDRNRWASVLESSDQFIEVARAGLPVHLIAVHGEIRRVLDAFDRDVAGRMAEA